MRTLPTLLSSTAAAVLLANVNASADSPVAITYVPNSLAEATIARGPWTLHQMVGRNPHDASGILPPSGTMTPFNPPTTKYGTPYKNYCVGGRVQTIMTALKTGNSWLWLCVTLLVYFVRQTDRL